MAAAGDHGDEPLHRHLLIDHLVPPTPRTLETAEREDDVVDEIMMSSTTSTANSNSNNSSSAAAALPAEQLLSIKQPVGLATTDDVASRGVIDTAAPIESVKAAVSKFGGIVNWKAPKPVTTSSSSNERGLAAAAPLKSVEKELERIQARVADMRRQAQDAETAKVEALAQVHAMKRLAEEMKLTLLHKNINHQAAPPPLIIIDQKQQQQQLEREEAASAVDGEMDDVVVAAAASAEIAAVEKKLADDVERALEEVGRLRAAASSLKLELEAETAALDAARRNMATSLQDELTRARAELLLHHHRRQLIKETTSDDENNGGGMIITLPLEQYICLCKGAEEAEKAAGERVAAAMVEVEDAKSSESRSSERLDEASREVEERKEALRKAAMALEVANEGKLGVEQELRAWRADNEQKRRAAAAATADGLDHDEEGEGEGEDDDDDGSSDVIIMNKTSSSTTALDDHQQDYEEAEEAAATAAADDDHGNPAVGAAAQIEGPNNDQDDHHHHQSFSEHSKRDNNKKKKKSFFPRVVMFLARKKAQSLK